MTAGTQESKPWYKTWRLIPAILFFPFTLAYLTWKTKWPMTAKLIVIGLIFIIFIGGTSSSSSKDENSTSVSIESPTPTPETITQPSQAPQKELSITERLDIIAKDKIDTDVVLEFQEQEGMILATISDRDHTFLNETDMVNSIWEFFIPFAKESFTYDGVNQIKVAITTEFVDSYGNSTTNNAVYVDMTKEDFELFNWENLRFTNPKDNQNLVDKSNYFVHGLIYKKIKEDKLKISF